MIKIEIPETINSNSIDSYIVEVGSELRVSGQLVEAYELYRLSLLVNSNYPPAYFYIGVMLYDRGDHSGALEAYKRALDINPAYPEALCNVGVIHKNLGNIELAIEFYTKSLHSNPNYQLVKHNMAIALNDLGTKVKALGEMDRALALYKKSLFYNSKHSDTYYNLGVIYSELRSLEKSIVSYELAVHFNPNYTEALNNLGVIYKELDNLEQSIIYYNSALNSNPKFPQSLNNLGVIYTLQGKMSESKKFIKKAISISSDYAEAYNNLGVIYRDIGKIDSSIECYEKCLMYSPNSVNAPHNRLLAVNYSITKSPDDIFNMHRLWGLAYMEKVQNEMIREYKTVFQPGKKLTIGYISSDFFTHSVSYFIDGILKHHTRDQFDIICYSNVTKEDSTTERLKSYWNTWRPIIGLSSKTVADLIHSDRVDILIELSGHTCGNRLDVLALKPAPIQISYLGYPNTTGLPTIQYRFTDDIADPIDTTQKYTETLFRLPHSFLTYSPPIPASGENTVPLPFEKNGYITFGSFNVLAKYSDSSLKTWLNILNSIPKSRLLLKSKPFACEKTKESFKRRLLKFGYDVDRVDLVGLFPFQKDHLNYYRMMDISLDTFPYAGTTTTCESLWMGVPVITLSGNCHSHNVGKSILTQIDQQQHLVADTIEHYLGIAIDLANDTNRLLEYRKSLREKMKSSYLCDNSTFTKNFEKSLQHIWDHFILSQLEK
eukprot:gene4889-6097_t